MQIFITSSSFFQKSKSIFVQPCHKKPKLTLLKLKFVQHSSQLKVMVMWLQIEFMTGMLLKKTVKQIKTCDY